MAQGGGRGQSIKSTVEQTKTKRKREQNESSRRSQDKYRQKFGKIGQENANKLLDQKAKAEYEEQLAKYRQREREARKRYRHRLRLRVFQNDQNAMEVQNTMKKSNRVAMIRYRERKRAQKLKNTDDKQVSPPSHHSTTVVPDLNESLHSDQSDNVKRRSHH